jgi:hypothetical protein
MLKLTRSDLRLKTRNQLAALFAQATAELGNPAADASDLADAQSALAMIAAEQARRGLAP